MRVTSSLTTVLTPTAVALGNFDGVHRGHQQVIQPILQNSEVTTPLTPSFTGTGTWVDELGVQIDRAGENCQSLSQTKATGLPLTTVVTFNPHPQEFFTGQPRTLLTPPDEKAFQMMRLGVEQLVLLPFDQVLANLSPQQFVEEILVRQLQAKRVSVGQDFRFGCQRAGTAVDLQAIAANYGIEVFIVPLHTSEGERISSSIIRQSLLEGEVERANRLLGRPYSLIGEVVQGQQLGRTLGFPTANLSLPPEKFLPRQGVYAVELFIHKNQKTGGGACEEGSKGTEQLLPGVMNIGYRPTVDGTYPTVEVHLLDWLGDLYGKTVTVNLQQFLRSEQKFVSLEALKTQIQADCATAKKVLIGNK